MADDDLEDYVDVEVDINGKIIENPPSLTAKDREEWGSIVDILKSIENTNQGRKQRPPSQPSCRRMPPLTENIQTNEPSQDSQGLPVGQGMQQLDHLLRLMEQMCALQRQNTRLREQAQYLTAIKTLQEMRNESLLQNCSCDMHHRQLNRDLSSTRFDHVQEAYSEPESQGDEIILTRKRRQQRTEKRAGRTISRDTKNRDMKKRSKSLDPFGEDAEEDMGKERGRPGIFSKFEKMREKLTSRRGSVKRRSGGKGLDEECKRDGDFGYPIDGIETKSEDSGFYQFNNEDVCPLPRRLEVLPREDDLSDGEEVFDHHQGLTPMALNSRLGRRKASDVSTGSSSEDYHETKQKQRKRSLDMSLLTPSGANLETIRRRSRFRKSSSVQDFNPRELATLGLDPVLLKNKSDKHARLEQSLSVDMEMPEVTDNLGSQGPQGGGSVDSKLGQKRKHGSKSLVTDLLDHQLSSSPENRQWESIIRTPSPPEKKRNKGWEKVKHAVAIKHLAEPTTTKAKFYTSPPEELINPTKDSTTAESPPSNMLTMYENIQANLSIDFISKLEAWDKKRNKLGTGLDMGKQSSVESSSSDPAGLYSPELEVELFQGLSHDFTRKLAEWDRKKKTGAGTSPKGDRKQKTSGKDKKEKTKHKDEKFKGEDKDAEKVAHGSRRVFVIEDEEGLVKLEGASKDFEEKYLEWERMHRESEGRTKRRENAPTGEEAGEGDEEEEEDLQETCEIPDHQHLSVDPNLRDLDPLANRKVQEMASQVDFPEESLKDSSQKPSSSKSVPGVEDDQIVNLEKRNLILAEKLKEKDVNLKVVQSEILGVQEQIEKMCGWKEQKSESSTPETNKQTTEESPKTEEPIGKKEPTGTKETSPEASQSSATTERLEKSLQLRENLIRFLQLEVERQRKEINFLRNQGPMIGTSFKRAKSFSVRDRNDAKNLQAVEIPLGKALVKARRDSPNSTPSQSNADSSEHKNRESLSITTESTMSLETLHISAEDIRIDDMGSQIIDQEIKERDELPPLPKEPPPKQSGDSHNQGKIPQNKETLVEKETNSTNQNKPAHNDRTPSAQVESLERKTKSRKEVTQRAMDGPAQVDPPQPSQKGLGGPAEKELASSGPIESSKSDVPSVKTDSPKVPKLPVLEEPIQKTTVGSSHTEQKRHVSLSPGRQTSPSEPKKTKQDAQKTNDTTKRANFSPGSPKKGGLVSKQAEKFRELENKSEFMNSKVNRRNDFRNGEVRKLQDRDWRKEPKWKVSVQTSDDVTAKRPSDKLKVKETANQVRVDEREDRNQSGSPVKKGLVNSKRMSRLDQHNAQTSISKSSSQVGQESNRPSKNSNEEISNASITVTLPKPGTSKCSSKEGNFTYSTKGRLRQDSFEGALDSDPDLSVKSETNAKKRFDPVASKTNRSKEPAAKADEDEVKLRPRRSSPASRLIEKYDPMLAKSLAYHKKDVTSVDNLKKKFCGSTSSISSTSTNGKPTVVGKLQTREKPKTGSVRMLSEAFSVTSLMNSHSSEASAKGAGTASSSVRSTPGSLSPASSCNSLNTSNVSDKIRLLKDKSGLSETQPPPQTTNSESCSVPQSKEFPSLKVPSVERKNSYRNSMPNLSSVRAKFEKSENVPPSVSRGPQKTTVEAKSKDTAEIEDKRGNAPRKCSITVTETATKKSEGRTTQVTAKTPRRIIAVVQTTDEEKEKVKEETVTVRLRRKPNTTVGSAVNLSSTNSPHSEITSGSLSKREERNSKSENDLKNVSKNQRRTEEIKIDARIVLPKSRVDAKVKKVETDSKENEDGSISNGDAKHKEEKVIGQSRQDRLASKRDSSISSEEKKPAGEKAPEGKLDKSEGKRKNSDAKKKEKASEKSDIDVNIKKGTKGAKKEIKSKKSEGQSPVIEKKETKPQKVKNSQSKSQNGSERKENKSSKAIKKKTSKKDIHNKGDKSASSKDTAQDKRIESNVALRNSLNAESIPDLIAQTPKGRNSVIYDDNGNKSKSPRQVVAASALRGAVAAIGHALPQPVHSAEYDDGEGDDRRSRKDKTRRAKMFSKSDRLSKLDLFRRARSVDSTKNPRDRSPSLERPGRSGHRSSSVDRNKRDASPAGMKGKGKENHKGGWKKILKTSKV